jgi:hypothetical protein
VNPDGRARRERLQAKRNGVRRGPFFAGALETTDGQRLVLRRVARPNAEQARILAALQLQLPERLSPDHCL